jgi:hypothetical protein
MPDTKSLTKAIFATGLRTPMPVCRLLAAYLYRGGTLAALTAAAAVVSVTSACAETTVPAPATSAASHSATAPTVPPDAAKQPPRYSAGDIERAFNFMDANKDGKISRQEAAGFRNVAKHFDAADTDKDGSLSLTEFGNALNRP